MIALTSRRTRCRPVVISDQPFIHDLFVNPEMGWRLRYRGATPSFEFHLEQALDGVHAQWIVEGSRSGDALGVVALSSPNYSDGFMYLTVIGIPRVHRTGLLMEATAICLDYAFWSWPIRKIYAETVDLNYESFRSGEGKLFSVEARLRAHTYVGGAFRDVYTLAFHRDAWMSRTSLTSAQLAPRGST